MSAGIDWQGIVGLSAEDRPFNTTPWVAFFSVLGGRAAIPKAPLDSFEWSKLVLFTSAAPCVLFLLGLVVAIVVVTQLCCREQTDAPPRPSAVPLLFFVVLTCTLLWVCSMYALESGAVAYEAAEGQLTRMIDDFTDALATVKSLNKTITNTIAQINDVHNCCPVFDIFVLCKSAAAGFQNNENVKAVDSIRLLLSEIYPELQGTLRVLTTFESHAHWADRFIVACCFGPMIMATALMLLVSISAVSTGGVSGKTLDRFIKCCFSRVGAIPLAMLIVVVTALSATGLAIGIVSGNLCTDPDDNVLGIVRSMSKGLDSEEVVNEASADYIAYYIKGEGMHPIDRHRLNTPAGDLTIHDTVKRTNDLLQTSEFTTLKNLLESQCSAWRDADLPGMAQEAQAMSDFVHERLSWGHVHQYYDSSVLTSVCGGVVSATGWFLLFHVPVGLACLPAFLILSHDLLSRSAACESSVHEELTTRTQSSDLDVFLHSGSESFADMPSPEAFEKPAVDKHDSQQMLLEHQ